MRLMEADLYQRCLRKAVWTIHGCLGEGQRLRDGLRNWAESEVISGILKNMSAG